MGKGKDDVKVKGKIYKCLLCKRRIVTKEEPICRVCK